MEIKMESVIYPLPSDSLILKKEEFWRVELPISYKSFIKVNNGGSPETKSFLCNNHRYAIIRFLCILEAPENIEIGMFDIDVTWSQLDERLTDDGDLLGVALLPIAVLFAGDFLCLDFRKSRDNPEVCVWDHEESDIFNSVTYYVAENFDKFVELLVK